MQNHNILILAPHTDDGELGCGASIAKFIKEGKKVTYIAFSSCSQSLANHLPPDTLRNECINATKFLGIHDVRFFDFQVRKLLVHRQEILEELIKINTEFNPDTVYVPAQHDIHQDHQVIYSEGFRAFKNSNVLGYELPWNNFKFFPNYFEKITEDELIKKQSALKYYISQEHRRYMDPDFQKSLAVVRGIQSNTSLAEAFEIYHIIN
jgi:LmbE family N-acetylglucosaminyl deacetylase